jgi:hypothetical protein
LARRWPTVVTWGVYAPAAGRLAAAMATISASRRPIRDDVERSNEPNCRMAQLPSAPANKGFLKKAAQTSN